ncbi:hypothetical protein ACQPYK_21355 [Streptosporangium sp. CA-135522]|uniref:hypothetical protein n=1 Tax=Streptosporangium sp. CA-135522 TaxID=3240072 RepID=UPI003D92B455
MTITREIRLAGFELAACRTPTPSEPPAMLGRVKANERIEGADHVDTDDHG